MPMVGAALRPSLAGMFFDLNDLAPAPLIQNEAGAARVAFPRTGDAVAEIALEGGGLRLRLASGRRGPRASPTPATAGRASRSPGPTTTWPRAPGRSRRRARCCRPAGDGGPAAGAVRRRLGARWSASAAAARPSCSPGPPRGARPAGRAQARPAAGVGRPRLPGALPARVRGPARACATRTSSRSCDAGEQDGRGYLVMALARGGSLAGRLAGRPARPGRRDRAARADRRRPRRGARRRAGAPRRHPGQHPARPRRPLAGRLRHRPAARRDRDDRRGAARRHGRVPRARGDRRRHGRAGLGPLCPGGGGLRGPRRPPAVRGRGRAGSPLRAPEPARAARVVAAAGPARRASTPRSSRGLAKDPRDRPASAGALVDALARAVARRPACRARPARPPGAARSPPRSRPCWRPARAAGPARDERWGRGSRRRPRRSRRVVTEPPLTVPAPGGARGARAAGAAPTTCPAWRARRRRGGGRRRRRPRGVGARRDARSSASPRPRWRSAYVDRAAGRRRRARSGCSPPRRPTSSASRTRWALLRVRRRRRGARPRPAGRPGAVRRVPLTPPLGGGDPQAGAARVERCPRAPSTTPSSSAGGSPRSPTSASSATPCCALPRSRSRSSTRRWPTRPSAWRRSWSTPAGWAWPRPRWGRCGGSWSCATGDEGEEIVALCNPRIVWRSDDEEVDSEGCLSIGEISVDVPRAARDPGRGPGRGGAAAGARSPEGFEARVIQHEMDHLDGVLILDRTEPEQRREALRALRDGSELRSVPR